MTSESEARRGMKPPSTRRGKRNITLRIRRMCDTCCSLVDDVLEGNTRPLELYCNHHHTRTRRLAVCDNWYPAIRTLWNAYDAAMQTHVATDDEEPLP